MSFLKQRNAVASPLVTAPSFADELPINHGPKDLIQGYFQAAELYLAQRDVVLKRVDPMEAVRLNRANEASWWRQVPILDAEDFPPVDNELVAFIGYDRMGDPVTAMSVRYFNLVGTTLKAEMESLRLFYGNRSELARRGVVCVISAPAAGRITGEVAYMGGFWVHPKARGQGLSFVVPRIARFASLGMWGVAYDVSLTGHKFYSRQKVVEQYDFEAIEPHYSYTINGRIQWEGSLVWSSRQALERSLPKHLAELSQAL